MTSTSQIQLPNMLNMVKMYNKFHKFKAGGYLTTLEKQSFTSLPMSNLSLQIKPHHIKSNHVALPH